MSSVPPVEWTTVLANVGGFAGVLAYFRWSISKRLDKFSDKLEVRVAEKDCTRMQTDCLKTLASERSKIISEVDHIKEDVKDLKIRFKGHHHSTSNGGHVIES